MAGVPTLKQTVLNVSAQAETIPNIWTTIRENMANANLVTMIRKGEMELVFPLEQCEVRSYVSSPPNSPRTLYGIELRYVPSLSKKRHSEMRLDKTLQTYRDALRTLEVVSPDGPFTEQATSIVSELGAEIWSYPISCMLCGETFTMDYSLESIYKMEDKPRGICAACDAKTTLEILEEQ